MDKWIVQSYPSASDSRFYALNIYITLKEEPNRAIKMRIQKKETGRVKVTKRHVSPLRDTERIRKGVTYYWFSTGL